jgi:peroxiredoxin
VNRLLPPGAVAPLFAAAGSDGGVYALADLLTGSRVLLVFYPANDTPG